MNRDVYKKCYNYSSSLSTLNFPLSIFHFPFFSLLFTARMFKNTFSRCHAQEKESWRAEIDSTLNNGSDYVGGLQNANYNPSANHQETSEGTPQESGVTEAWNTSGTILQDPCYSLTMIFDYQHFPLTLQLFWLIFIFNFNFSNEANKIQRKPTR